MKRRMFGAAILFCFSLVLIGGCYNGKKSTNDFKDAQRLIDKTVASHPEIIRLTIHAVPSGQTQSIIIACNIREKLGKLDDPEDLEVVKTKKTIVLKESGNLDVTMPILDKSGNAIAATGITLKGLNDTNEQALTEKAKSIAAELSKAIQDSSKPLW
jgi:hypothetical protein